MHKDIDNKRNKINSLVQEIIFLKERTINDENKEKDLGYLEKEINILEDQVRDLTKQLNIKTIDNGD